MDEATKFLVICIEEYGNKKNMNGKDVLNLFNEYKVTDYIMEFHQILHCQGIESLIWELDDFIANHQPAQGSLP